MNKICTSLEQSKKLIELEIDINTADMYWWNDERRYEASLMDAGFISDVDIPAWSLSALLELIPNYVINKADDKVYANLYYGLKSSYDNLVDAAFEMVCWLKENKKI